LAYDETLATRIRDILSVRRDVTEKKMFGGLCFLVNGKMSCGITSTDFMVRVGKDELEAALARPHARPMDFTGRPSKGAVYVAKDGLRTRAALATWVNSGVAFALEEFAAAPVTSSAGSLRGAAPLAGAPRGSSRTRRK
jgi:TfoX/Sxy family transcriptional regulator of competence genes